MSARSTDRPHALTPGMERDLIRFRDWVKEHDQPPTPREWAKAYRMANASADAALGRLAAAGLIGSRLAHRYDERGGGPGLLFELLDEADQLLSTIAVGDRPRRDEWRKKAGAVLSRPGLEVA